MPTRRKKRGTRINIKKNIENIYLENINFESSINNIVPRQSKTNNDDLGYIIESRPAEISENELEKIILEIQIKSKNEFEIEQDQQIIKMNNEELNCIDKQPRINILKDLLKECEDNLETKEYILEEIKSIERRQNLSEEEYIYESNSDDEEYIQGSDSDDEDS